MDFDLEEFQCFRKTDESEVDDDADNVFEFKRKPSGYINIAHIYSFRDSARNNKEAEARVNFTHFYNTTNTRRKSIL